MKRRYVLTLGALALAFSAAVAWSQSGDKQMPDLGANASLHGRRVFPEDNPWNRDISNDEVDPNSAKLIASIGPALALHPDFGTTWGIPYVIVGGAQPRVDVKFEYADESDPGPYPIPPDAPIEGGASSDGDRHVLVIDRDQWKLYELFAASKIDAGKAWKAGSGAIFDLESNDLRPEGWTSADAAGLPVFPGLVRYDEVYQQQRIAHALRFTVKKTRRAYVTPARHWASRSDNPSLPPMGMRVRLKASYDISSFPADAQVILKALKQYGMILADNGGNWFVSGAPHPKWNDVHINALKKVRGSDFEVVRMSDPRK
jgi:hypothetical protein